jgi:putative DNA primase/helicase
MKRVNNQRNAMMTKKPKKRDPLANVTIVGEGFDEFDQRYLKLKVNGSTRSLPPYSMAEILEPKRLYRELGDAGCKLFSRQLQNHLQGMLQDYEQVGAASFSVVTRLGSFRSFYVRPDEIIGSSPVAIEPAFGSLDVGMLAKYRRRGSLDSWQEKIGKLCTGNSRLMFAASLACTGPILPFVAGPRTGGFQISGKAESGKTAAAMIAGSIWGCHRDSIRREKGFAESWHTTGNKLEETAQAHSDALLIADETNLAGATDQARAVAVLDGMFRLSENMQKGRLNESKTAFWRLYFLSTSNLTLDELAELGGVPIDDQHRGRLVDIVLPLGPGTFGIYENLHGFSDGAALTDAIKARCRSVFGTPGYQFVRKLYKDKDSRFAAKKFVAARRKYYIDRIRQEAKSKGLKPLERATARFATVYAAGCLAIKYGIFTWSRKALFLAVLSCQLDGLTAARGRTDQVTNLRPKLMDYLAQNRRHFVSLNGKRPSSTDHKFGSVPGYIHTHNGIDWLYLTSNQLKAIIGTGKAAARLKRRLVEQGLMASTRKKALVQRPIFKAKGNKGYRWVHAFRASLLENSIDAPLRRALNKNR